MPIEKQKINAEKTNIVTLRSIILGLLLVPLNVYWVIVSELRFYNILTLNPLFVTPIFYLFAFVGVNAVLRRIAPRYVLKPAEMVTIYIMLVISCTVATHDFIINLMSIMGWASWFATPDNKWETLLFPHLPKWLFVWDKEVLSGYFYGNSSILEPGVLKAWLAPLGFWSIFILAVGWMMFCLSVMFRKAWTDETRLSFPVVRLPLAMTEPFSPTSMLASKVLWLGFFVAFGIGVVNGLSLWLPSIPEIRVRSQWIHFTSPPWTAAAPMCTTFYPFAIGLAFLVPLDVSFSCWFFYLFVKMQGVLGTHFGYGSIPDFPFVSEQGIGAWFAFGFSLLFINRRHLMRVVKLALENPGKDDAGEPVSYRTAVFGLIAGMAVFFVFWRAAGMSTFWALLVLIAYLILAICITRVRAEAGGQHTVWDLEPKNLARLFGSNMLGPSVLAASAVSHWYWRLNRSHTMPSQLEAFKLAQEHKINLRSLAFPILAAFALATFFGMWACLHVFYRDGALAKCQGFGVWTGIETYDWLGNALSYGFKAEPHRWGVVGGAALFVAFLFSMRARFTWFPFHPLGYCIGPALIWLWLPFLIAWLLKLLILRYGGLKLYSKALPFFLGLILGDYTIGASWALIAVIFNIPTYQIFH